MKNKNKIIRLSLIFLGLCSGFIKADYTPNPLIYTEGNYFGVFYSSPWGDFVYDTPEFKSINLEIEGYVNESITLMWESENTTYGADTCEIDIGTANVIDDSNRTGNPGDITVFYTMKGQYIAPVTCVNPVGDATTDYINIKVNDPLPTVSLSSDKNSVVANENFTLTWSSSTTPSGFISNCDTNWLSGTDNGGENSTESSVVFSNTVGTKTFTVDCYNSSGDMASDSVSVVVSELIPTVSLSTNKTSMYEGDSATLTLSSNNSDTCTISNYGGAISTSGTYSVSPTSTTTYTASCTSSTNTTRTDSVTITVNDVIPTVSLSTNKTSMYEGDSATLTLSSSNANSCTISNYGGAVSTSGTYSVTPATTTTYTATCTSISNVSRTDSVTVTVNEIIPTVSFTTNKTSIYEGDSATLTLNSSNAVSCSISNYGGAVSTSGTYSVSPSSTTTYTATCTSSTGGTKNASVSITVNDAVPTVSLTSNKTTMYEGDTATLTLSTTRADSCSISNYGGAVSTSGNYSVTPASTTTYTATCTSVSNVTRTNSVTITVNEIIPTVSLTLNDYYIYEGQNAILTLGSTNAVSCTISNYGGAVSTSGNYTVVPASTTTYTATCTSSTGATSSASAKLTVSPPPATASLSASPTSVIQGGSTTLSWSSTNASSCTSNFGTIGTSGSKSVVVSNAGSNTYSINCSGATRSVTVTAEPSATPVAYNGSLSCSYTHCVNAKDNKFFLVGDDAQGQSGMNSFLNGGAGGDGSSEVYTRWRYGYLDGTYNPAVSRVAAISGGTLAIRSGKLWVTGINTSGQLAMNTNGLSCNGTTSISTRGCWFNTNKSVSDMTGVGTTTYVLSGTTLYKTGGSYSSPSYTSVTTGVSRLFKNANGTKLLFLKGTTLYSYNGSSVVSELSNVVTAHNGGTTLWAVRSDGKVWVKTSSTWKETPRTANSIAALQSKGYIVQGGVVKQIDTNGNIVKTHTETSNITHLIGDGNMVIYALKANGDMMSMGSNTKGQLGLNYTSTTATTGFSYVSELNSSPYYLYQPYLHD